MADTFTSLLIHLVFSTKHRHPILHASLCERLYPYLGGILREKSCDLLEIGGMPDHVHLLVLLKTDCSVAEIVRMVKSSSTKWIHQTFPEHADFFWQSGFGAFSVSESQAAKVRRYIRNQAEHHERFTFQDEFVALLRRHGIVFEERRLMD